jgi:hypothetical protein
LDPSKCFLSIICGVQNAFDGPSFQKTPPIEN